MSNIKNRKREKDLSVKQYFEQSAASFEQTLFKSESVELFKYMSARGLDSIIAHAQEELKRRANADEVLPVAGPDDGLSAEEKFKRAREG
ncbi:hypothetical protein CCP3SC15_380018 [Gammaproteobacteria bacterium]